MPLIGVADRIHLGGQEGERAYARSTLVWEKANDALPPIAPGPGRKWTALNGHSATFDGTSWVADSPATNNLAVLIANFQVMIGAKQTISPGTTLPNRGTGGPVLNAANQGLIRVEGPGMWLPGTNPQGLTIAVAARPLMTGVQTMEVHLGGNVAQDSTATDMAIAGSRDGNHCSGWIRLNPNTRALWYLRGNGTTLYQAQWIYPAGLVNPWFRCFHDPAVPVAKMSYSVNKGATWVAMADQPYNVGVPTMGNNFFAVGTEPNGRFFKGVIEYVRVDNNGTTVIELNSSDIGAAQPNATTITPTVGPVFTVYRGTTGPTTILVPTGKTIYAVPDADLSKRLRTGDDPALDLLTNEDGILFLGFQRNSPVDGARPINTKTSGTTGMWISSGISSWSTTVFGSENLGSDSTGTGTQVPLNNVPSVVFSIANRATGRIVLRVYDATGERLPVTDSALDNLSNVTPAGGLTVGCPASGVTAPMYGGFWAFGWRKGVGIASEYTDANLAALAAYLLEHA